jgi:hypothetical protein
LEALRDGKLGTLKVAAINVPMVQVADKYIPNRIGKPIWLEADDPILQKISPTIPIPKIH